MNNARSCVEDDSLFELLHHQSDHVQADWQSINSHKFEKHVSVTSFAIRKRCWQEKIIENIMRKKSGSLWWRWEKTWWSQLHQHMFELAEKYLDQFTGNKEGELKQRTERRRCRRVACNILLTYFILLIYSVSLQAPYNADFQVYTFNLEVYEKCLHALMFTCAYQTIKLWQCVVVG